jgi:hypothetical protein
LTRRGQMGRIVFTLTGNPKVYDEKINLTSINTHLRIPVVFITRLI